MGCQPTPRHCPMSSGIPRSLLPGNPDGSSPTAYRASGQGAGIRRSLLLGKQGTASPVPLRRAGIRWSLLLHRERDYRAPTPRGKPGGLSARSRNNVACAPRTPRYSGWSAGVVRQRAGTAPPMSNRPLAGGAERGCRRVWPPLCPDRFARLGQRPARLAQLARGARLRPAVFPVRVRGRALDNDPSGGRTCAVLTAPSPRPIEDAARLTTGRTRGDPRSVPDEHGAGDGRDGTTPRNGFVSSSGSGATGGVTGVWRTSPCTCWRWTTCGPSQWEGPTRTGTFRCCAGGVMR